MSILTQAANILDISEFAVLERAYLHWYGERASFDFINRTFSDYLHAQQPPYWARHYALTIINRFDAELNTKNNFLQLLQFLFWDYKQPANQDGRSLAA